MLARDIMTNEVISVAPSATVTDIARLLLKHRISAVPVLDAAGHLVGIVSEGDLVRRVDDEAAHGSWWLRFLSGPEAATDYVKRHGRRAEEVMTRDVITVTPDAPLGTIARLLERRHIKRVPVVDGAGRLVGIVSRANLLHGLASIGTLPETQRSDEATRERVIAALRAAPGLVAIGVNATVTDGTAHLWGVVASSDEERVARLAAENVEGVRSVEVNLRRMQPWADAD